MRSHTRTAATPSPSSSSKNSNTRQQHPHLSGAYIRSIVKQLSSSSSTARSKGRHFNTAMSSTPHDQQLPHQDDQEHKQQDEQEQAPTAPLVARQPVQVKKQVSRRLHTSRPYQERLINMAEVRREIVTALKVHRATMRQSKDQQEQQLLPLQQQLQVQVQVPLQEQSQGAVGATATMTPMSTVSYDAFFSNDQLLISPLTHLMAGTSYSSSSTLPYLTPVTLAPGNGGLDHLACSLPALPLGLNLSFQGFNGFVYDVENSNNFFDRHFIRSSPDSSCSAYSSPSAAMASHESAAAVDTAENAPSPASFHPVLEDEEMAAICSIGERRGIDWSDTVDVATPAWSSKLILDQSTEDGGCELGAAAGQEGGTIGVMEDVVGMPAGWLCDGLGEQGMITGSSKPAGVLEMHLDGDYCYCHQGDSDGEGIALPCMEIGEIEGWLDGTGSGSHDHDHNMHYSR